MLLKKLFQAWFLLRVEWESLQILKELIINKIRKRVQLVELKVTHSKTVPMMVLTEHLRIVQLQPDNLVQLMLQPDLWPEETSSNSQDKLIHLKMMESFRFRVQPNSKIFWCRTRKLLLQQEVAVWILFSLNKFLLSLEDRLWQNRLASRIEQALSSLIVGH